RRQGQADRPRRGPRAAAADVPGQVLRRYADAGQDPRPAGGRAAGQPDEGLRRTVPARALEVRGLTWRVGGLAIVDRVDLAVDEGEFVAVIGPNGAGKTSLFNLISGLRTPNSGSVSLGGADVSRLPPHERARRGLGRTFQSSAVFGSLS